MKSHYEILGLEPSATSEEIKKAYRKLSLKFHPDKNEGDVYFSSLFQQINEAYLVLSDSEKRRSYDKMRLRTEEASRIAESLKKREEELLYQEKRFRERTWERPVTQQPKPQSSYTTKAKKASAFTIVHLKYALYGVIAIIIMLIGSKQEPVAKETPSEQYSEASSTGTKKKKRKLKWKTKSELSTPIESPAPETDFADSAVAVEVETRVPKDTVPQVKIIGPMPDTLDY